MFVNDVHFVVSIVCVSCYWPLQSGSWQSIAFSAKYMKFLRKKKCLMENSIGVLISDGNITKGQKLPRIIIYTKCNLMHVSASAVLIRIILS